MLLLKLNVFRGSIWKAREERNVLVCLSCWTSSAYWERRGKECNSPTLKIQPSVEGLNSSLSDIQDESEEKKAKPGSRSLVLVILILWYCKPKLCRWIRYLCLHNQARNPNRRLFIKSYLSLWFIWKFYRQEQVAEKSLAAPVDTWGNLKRREEEIDNIIFSLFSR